MAIRQVTRGHKPPTLENKAKFCGYRSDTELKMVMSANRRITPQSTADQYDFIGVTERMDEYVHMLNTRIVFHTWPSRVRSYTHMIPT